MYEEVVSSEFCCFSYLPFIARGELLIRKKIPYSVAISPISAQKSPQSPSPGHDG